MSSPVSERGERPGPCSRCEALPERIEGQGRLYLWFPLRHTLGHALRLLNGHGAEMLERGEGVLLRLDGAQAGELAEILSRELTAEEQDGTHILWIPGKREPELADFPRVVSLRRFQAVSRSAWLLGLLGDKRYTSHFQPIVAATDTASVFGHEALLRGLDDQDRPVPPGDMFRAAQDSDLMFQLDLAARQSAIREAVRLGLESRIFINFAPNAIYDPLYCLRSTVATISEAGVNPDRIVFEVTESEQVRDLQHLDAILTVYRKAGFQIALDDLGAGYSSLNLIHRLRPDLVKLDMDLIRNVDQDDYKAAIAETLLALARRLGIRTVAEGVETQGELDWLRNHGADYVQGFLIAPPSGKPASIP